MFPDGATLTGLQVLPVWCGDGSPDKAQGAAIRGIPRPHDVTGVAERD